MLVTRLLTLIPKTIYLTFILDSTIKNGKELLQKKYVLYLMREYKVSSN